MALCPAISLARSRANRSAPGFINEQAESPPDAAMASNSSNHGQSNEMKTAAVDATEPRPPRSTGFAELFLLFSGIGVSSFGGGVSAWMHTAMVERRRWLDETEFSSALALARIMPGVNIVNLAVLIGHRLVGLSGAVAAVAGLLVGPSLIVIAAAVLYRYFAGVMILDAVLAGTAAAAAGL